MTSSSSSLLDASNGGKKLNISPKSLHDELTRGREMTDQLRVMLCEITGGEGTSPPSSSVVTAGELLAAQGLVGKIVDTFTQSILMLDEESHTPPVIDSSPARDSEDSGESGKRKAQKDRRGCYKRRRSQKTYIKDTPGSFVDGYAWRKYGQKKILDSKHPRNYYRCTHRYDQSCQAKKHVQQIQENPPLYRTTYDGQHTCKNAAATTRSSPHQLFTTHDHNQSSSLLWNFQLQPNNYNFTVSIRDRSEFINKTPYPSDYNNDNNKCYSVVNGGYYMSPDHLKVFDQADQQHSRAVADFSSAGSDIGDVISNVSEVYSCTESTHDSMQQQQMHDMLSGGDSAFDDFLMDARV